MKKILIAALLATSLAGCASLQNFENQVSTAWQIVTSAAVTPQQIIVAGNAFDALEATATQYLNYCKSVAYKPQACARGNRLPVVKAVRAGQAARTALEPYAVSGKAGPAELYNVLAASINTLQSASLPIIATQGN